MPLLVRGVKVTGKRVEKTPEDIDRIVGGDEKRTFKDGGGKWLLRNKRQAPGDAGKHIIGSCCKGRGRPQG